MVSCRALARLPVCSARSANTLRTLTTCSRSLRPAIIPVDITTSSTSFQPAEIASAVAQSQSLSISDTAKKPRASERAARAKQVIQWSWLSEEQIGEVRQALKSADADSQLPSWLEAEHSAARSFRSARSRLWLPAEVPETAEAGAGESVESWLDAEILRRGESLERNTKASDQLAVWRSLSLEEQRDEILKDVWKYMSAVERRNALVECRFTCLRKLGWRSGYSAGYPVPAGSEDALQQAELVAMTSGQQASQAISKLRQRDEELAWKAWVKMDAAQRSQEERDAWSARDRSTLYIDDSPTSNVLGGPMPRWFPTPQRAGKLVFLPNFIIRLVRNTTPRDKPYDPWKATFRVPLYLHKHAVKSYLLSVYGLRTTWIRSMIYRSRLLRSSDRRLITGTGRTFKKVEVGLLEPFVFPALTDVFKKRHLYSGEWNLERSKLFMKVTGARRWRSGKSLAPSAEEARMLAKDDELVLVNPEDREDKKTTPVAYGRRERIATKKHGSILRMIEERRKQRMREIDSKAEEMKRNHAE